MAWPYSDEKSEKETSKKSSKGAKPKAMPEGVTLKVVVERLEAKYGWEELAARIRINCFAKDPSFKSSLKFLRRTPWARAKVEELYLKTDWSE